MTEFAIFSKAADRILKSLTQDIDKLHDLLEELNLDADNVDDARNKVTKMQLAYADVKRAIGTITEEDMAAEEEEEEPEEDEEEAE